MRHWCHALLALFFIAAMSKGQAQRQSGGPSLEPEYFEFAEGHAYMGSERIVWEHGKLVFVKRVADMKGDGKFLETTEKLDPPKEAWSRFWQQIDAAGIWQWQASYTSAMSSAADGSSWSLEARHANRQIKSQGYNTTPSRQSTLSFAMLSINCWKLHDENRR